MRNASNCSSSNIQKKGLKDKPNNFKSPVSRLHKKRLCLKCGGKFPSEGTHNRICVKCILINDRILKDTYSLNLRISDVMNCAENIQESV